MGFNLTRSLDNSPPNGRVGWLENAMGKSLKQTWPPETAGRVYYVSPTGSDTNDGLTLTTPFLTLGKARDVATAYKASPGLPAGGIAIILRGGKYFFQTGDFRINVGDSGEAGKPIVYKAYRNEVPRLIGGKQIANNVPTLVTSGDARWSRINAAARGNLYKIDLAAQGIASYGQLIDLINKSVDIAPVEFIVNGIRKPLAQYPKKGYQSANFLMTAGAMAANAVAFASADAARIETWAAETDAWMCGFFNAPYSMEYGQIASIDAANDKFNLTTTAGVTASTMLTNKPYFVRNILEELTQPGEYYLHKASGTLYFYPDFDVSTAEMIVTVADKDVARTYGASYIGFEGINFEGSRRSGLRVDGTTPVGVYALNCKMINNGTDGVDFNGTGLSARECEVFGQNNSGFDIYGGVKSSLTYADNIVSKCKIHDTGYWKPTAKSPIIARDVGYKLIKNEIYNFDGFGIMLYGNDHLVQFNKVHDGCRMVNDAGAIYTVGTWKHRGHVIRWNHVYGFQVSNLHGSDIAGIYIDDVTSDCKITANIVNGAPGYGFRLSGGRDDKFTSNIAINCGVAFQYDNRALARNNNSASDVWNLLERLTDNSVSYQTGVWAARYPFLAAIPNSFAVIDVNANNYTQPLGSVISRNCAFNCGAFEAPGSYESTAPVLEYIGQNLTNSDPMLTYGAASAYDAGSPVFGLQGFIDFPYGEVGPTSADEVLTNEDWYDVRIAKWYKHTNPKYWEGGKYVTFNSQRYLLINLARNGSFENGADEWTPQGALNTSATAFEGAAAMRFVDANGGLQDIQAKATDKLHVCGRIAISAWTSGNFAFGAFDYAAATNLVYTNVSALTAYVLKSIEKIASAATATAVGGLRIRAYGSGGPVMTGDLDAVMVFNKTAVFGPGNEPTPAQLDAIIAAIAA